VVSLYGAAPAGLRSGKAARRKDDRVRRFHASRTWPLASNDYVPLPNGGPVSRSALRRRPVTQRCDHFRNRLDTCCQSQREAIRTSVGSDPCILSSLVFPIRRNTRLVQGRHCGIHHGTACLQAGIFAVLSIMVRSSKASRQYGGEHPVRYSRPRDFDGACRIWRARGAKWPGYNLETSTGKKNRSSSHVPSGSASITSRLSSL
jgi:hypothetical protein